MNGNVAEIIKTRLREAFNPSHLVIHNFSKEHSGHNPESAKEGAETHFEVEITAQALEGKSRIEKHRLVMAVLADLIPHPIHALTLKFGG
jgi:BolA protein